MPIAQSASQSISLLGLTFLAGFTLAALIFSLLLRNKRRARSAARTPKHALGNPVGAQARTSSTAVIASGDEPVQTEPNPTEPDRPGEFPDVPTVPTDLFEQRFEAKFERTRRRLERLRAQVNEIG